MLTDDHMEAYVHALQCHDWTFQYSDDAGMWRRGKESLAALKTAQVLIDPTFAVWNQHAPENYRVHVVPGQQGGAT